MVKADAERAPWQAKGEQKREAVRQMFAEIAPRYDLLNSFMSLSRHRRWRAYAVRVLGLEEGDTALDVCCGTGDFLSPLRKAVGPSGKLAGLDFCLPMLEKARSKAVGGTLVQGDACRLPVRSGSVNAVTVGWGIRNVPDIDLAHLEIARVLKHGGRFVSVDMALPRNAAVRAASRFVCGACLPALGSLFGLKKAYTYLPKSTEQFASREELADSMRRAGFEEVGWKDFMGGNICVHWGVKR
jgi:demethylmenaquinone methyltransferase/2-methoxy-6-polyprenyl-1,4-benzoquinol methylase